MENNVVIKGGGDIATGIAAKLHNSGLKILLLEKEKPLVIRRTVAFAQAIYDGETVVEDLRAVRAYSVKDVYSIWQRGHIPIMADERGAILQELKPDIVVDGTMAKKNTGMHRGIAPITIGVGPGFEAGKDVDAVVETQRGHDLGKILWEGFAAENTGIPGVIMSYGKERVIYSPGDGVIRHLMQIGDRVEKGQMIAMVGKEPVKAPISGVLRGLIMEGLEVTEGLKIADVDPRGIKAYCYSISDKARAIGGGVLEAILFLKRLKKTMGRNDLDVDLIKEKLI